MTQTRDTEEGRPPFALPLTETFQIACRQSDKVYQISVALPFSYAASGQHYPVFYTLDANLSFGSATELSRLLPLRRELREIIVVGVGYPSFDLMEFGHRRVHDFYPSREWAFDGPRGERLRRAFESAGPRPPSGGALDFLEFLVEQVKPRIESDYRADPTDTCLYGNSAGGAFAVFALFTRPGAFQKFLCGSPAFSVNNHELFDLEEQYAREHDDLTARVFLAAGQDELDDEEMAAFSIVGGTTRMYELLKLREYPTLDLGFYLSPGDGHGVATFENMSRGLRWLWPGGR